MAEFNTARSEVVSEPLLLASSIQVLIGTVAAGFKEAQASLSYLSLVPTSAGMIIMFAAPEPAPLFMFIPCLAEQLVMNAWLKGATVPASFIATSMLVTSVAALLLAYLTVRRFDSDRFL